MKMTNQKEKKLFKNSFFFAVGDISSKVIIFLMVPFYTNILTTEQYSISDLITTTVSLASPFFSLVIAEAVMRFALEKNENKKYIFSIGINVIIIGTIILSSISYIIFQNIPLLKDYWLYFILYYFTFNLYNVETNFLKGTEKLNILVITGILNTLLFVLFNVLFLLFMKIDIRGYLLATILANSITSFIIFLFARLYNNILPFWKIPRYSLKEMLKYSLPMIPNSAMWWINNSSDRYLVTYMVSAMANGVYSVAYKIPSIFSVIIAIFLQAWQISVVDGFGTKEGNDFFSNMYDYFLQANIILCATIIAFTKLIASLLFAKNFYEAWTFSIVLIIGYSFHSLAGFVGTVYTSAKRTTLLFVSTLIAAIVNIILNIILIGIFGTMGAAIATMISYFVAFTIRRIAVDKYITINVKTRKYVLQYFLLIISCVIMLLNVNISIYFSVAIMVCLFYMNKKFFIFCFQVIKQLKKNR